jgi:hypothetical protein
VVRGVAAEPDRELRADREQGRQHPVERQRVEPKAVQAGEPRVHDMKVNRGGVSVIGHSADPGAGERSADRLIERSPDAPTTTPRLPPTVGRVSKREGAQR